MWDPDSIAAPGSPERELLDRLDPSRMPRHVAVIMDGNGRWAKARNLPRVEGHRAGIKAVRRTVTTASKLKIPVITLYAFSTENWKRPRFEVLTLMGLLKEYLNTDLNLLLKNGIRLKTIGRIDQLDRSVVKAITRAEKATAHCRGTLVQIALNYSGRQELTNVVKEAARQGAAGLNPDSIDESWVSQHLFTAGAPDPDLLIRTSGEQRISNFLLWQIAYAEIYFTPVLWPDFGTKEFLEALVDYQRRERRFGGLSPQEEQNLFDSPPHHGTKENEGGDRA